MPTAPKMPPSFLAIGRITAPHGIRGEVKVEIMTDFPDRFKPGARAYLGAGDVGDLRAKLQGVTTA